MWERAYPSRYTSLDYGYPRNDVFYTSDAQAVRAARERLGIPPGRTAVLYAPTHRDYEAGFTPASTSPPSPTASAKTPSSPSAPTTSTAAPPPR